MSTKPCNESLASANTYLRNAGGAFVLGTMLLVVAIAANAKFFTAPAALVVAIGALLALTPVAAWLSSAAREIREMQRNGCIPSECEGKRSALMGLLNAAAGLASGAVGAVAASHYLAPIPWLGTALLVVALAAAIGASVAIARLAAAGVALEECLKSVALSRGPLEAGEKASDPWLLRLKPGEGSTYAVPVDGSTAIIEDNYIDKTFLRCSRVSVGQWQISAVASIIAPAGVRVDFTWSLDGKPLGAGTVAPDGRQSVLTHIIASSTALEHTLRVDAKDKGGFARIKEAIAEVGETALVCRAWLALVQPERKSPAVPWTAERLRPAFDAFYRGVNEIQRRTPVSGTGHAPVDIRR